MRDLTRSVRCAMSAIFIVNISSRLSRLRNFFLMYF
jgi:hypothetical protein